jgi:hypothetical protein
MRGMAMAVLSLAALFLLIGAAAPAGAGVEPSPFREAVNQLESVENELESVETRLGFALDDAPDPGAPGIGGVVNRLGAMESSLDRLDARLDDIMDGVPEGQQGYPQEVADGLGGVRDVAWAIASAAWDFLESQNPGGGDPHHLYLAVQGVGDAAYGIVLSVDGYLRVLPV